MTKPVRRKLRNRMGQPVTGYGLAIVLIVCISLTGASLAISLAVARNAVRQFCDIVVTQTDSYRQTPPTTDAGRNLAGKFETLRERLECPPPPKGPLK